MAGQERQDRPGGEHDGGRTARVGDVEGHGGQRSLEHAGSLGAVGFRGCKTLEKELRWLVRDTATELRA
jgi:hypothetical protein